MKIARQSFTVINREFSNDPTNNNRLFFRIRNSVLSNDIQLPGTFSIKKNVKQALFSQFLKLNTPRLLLNK
jgi:hypothetical protein